MVAVKSDSVTAALLHEESFLWSFLDQVESCNTLQSTTAISSGHFNHSSLSETILPCGQCSLDRLGRMWQHAPSRSHCKIQ
jgi:hypothetical protein